MVTSQTPIKGRVAKILNSRELVINRGSKDGVQLGMRFSVQDKKGENVIDPETGAVLGSIYRTKVEVEIVKVEDRLSLARTFKSERVNVGGQGFAAASAAAEIFAPPRYETRYETLRTDESTWENLDESQSLVKTDDPVEQVIAVPSLVSSGDSATLSVSGSVEADVQAADSAALSEGASVAESGKSAD